MNNNRRNLLKSSVALLDQASDIISQALDCEQNHLDNIPDNLQDSDRYYKMECAIENLENAIDCIDDAKDSIAIAVE